MSVRQCVAVLALWVFVAWMSGTDATAGEGQAQPPTAAPTAPDHYWKPPAEYRRDTRDMIHPWPKYPWWKYRPMPPFDPYNYPPIVGPYYAHGMGFDYPRGRTYELSKDHVYVDRPAPGYVRVPRGGTPHGRAGDETVTLADLIQRGDNLFARSYYQPAARRYAQAVPFLPGDGVIRVKLAGALFAIGKYRQASAALRDALRLMPLWPRTGADCRAGYGPLPHFKDHLRALAASLRHNVNDVAGLTVLGYMLFHSGDLARAQSVFRRLLALDPNDAFAKAYMAVIEGRPAATQITPAPSAAPGPPRKAGTGRRL